MVVVNIEWQDVYQVHQSTISRNLRKRMSILIRNCQKAAKKDNAN